MSNKAIKYRLYPTIEQAVLFAKTFGCCRKVWNLMLADKKDSYERTGSFGKQTPAMYKKDYPYLKEVDSLALANVQLNLNQAMKNCFVSKHCKFPVFKSSKHSRRSYTTNNQKDTVAVYDRSVRLPKVGAVRAKIHRLPDENWKTKSATVSQDSDGKFYVSILFEYESVTVSVPVSDNAVELDYKSDGLYVDSNGSSPRGSHKYYRESQKKLAKAQRRLSRKQGARKGEAKSNNYLKQKRWVAKIYRHSSNQRHDYLHKKSAEIANRYDVVCVESLNMRAMSNKGFGNGKATLDNGYGMFLDMLEYKLAERGKHFIRVDKWYPSSQICHCCGRKKKMTLADRIYSCECGYTGDRDHNAAINILNEGLRILRQTI